MKKGPVPSYWKYALACLVCFLTITVVLNSVIR